MSGTVFDLNVNTQERKYNFQKEEFIVVAPTSGSIENLNKNGAIILKSSTLEHPAFMPESFIKTKCTLRNAANTADLGAENITLEHNFFPRLFSQMRLDIGSSQFESIDNPGEADTMLKLVTYDKTYSDTYGQIEGWIPDDGDAAIVAAATNLTSDNALTINSGFIKRKRFYNNAAKTFTIIWKLSPLFGFTEYNRVIKDISVELRLVRSMNDEEIFFGEGGAAAIARLRVDSLEWFIPMLTPSLENEIFLSKYLSNNSEIKFPYLQRTVHTKIINSVSDDWPISSVTNAPRYVFVVFKNNAAPAGDANNHKYLSFIGANYIKEIRLDLNQTKYPDGRFLELEPINYDFSEAYGYYARLCRSFGNSPQLSPLNFRENYHIFCFDLTAQPEIIKKTGINITVRIRLNAVQEFRAYALVLEEAVQSINIKRNTATKIM